MYKKTGAQLSFYDYVRPFGGTLNEENRWIRLAQELDWKAMEEQYSRQFSSRGGNTALPVRMAFGCLVIREALSLTDAETVRQIQENPYLQYFIGLNEFITEAPFSPRSMEAFRRRIPPEPVTQAAQRLWKITSAK